ncbi:carboxyl/choline esterase CCE006a [Danaus plexippus plexippus]|uniref:Carboxylic ester hydrolase n=1 Tax=Danaus plexippus plexippus TaxID=278856 RepID=A0A212FJ67_DANPL|nr:carboxyl/choline esterase CCE006a [Danaus plexippus plexippus]
MGFVILLLFACAAVQGLVRVDPLVKTKQGLIKGIRADDGDYSMFLGIPYAIVDENNPFGPSIPQTEFKEIYNANDDSRTCPQVDEFTNQITGTLDCLRLNVYVPNIAGSRNKLPVLIWIHGGGFSGGDGGRFVTGPKFLVRHDVVLVTMNYRLGPYGFMCLDTPEVPGNQGLKDQLLALRWIKDNIAAFGGDENKMTLMGESAGASSVDFHLLSDKESLFDQVILQSGSALLTLLGESIPDAPLRLTKQLGYETSDVDEALSYLSKMDTNSVINATLSSHLFFKVCIEKRFDDVDGFVTEHPLMVDSPKIKNTPMLAGFNNKETLMMYAHMRPEQFKGYGTFRNVLEGYFTYDDEFAEMEDLVRRFYIGDEEMSEALRWDLMEFNSDLTFNFPVQWTIDHYLQKGSKIYQYLFSYSGERNFLKKRMNITTDGAAHADEIAYLFDISYEDTPTHEDQRMIDQMTTLWTNFAKFGDPTPETTDLLPVKWVPATKEINNYLDLDKELALRRLPYNKRLTFLKFFFKTNMHRLTLLTK